MSSDKDVIGKADALLRKHAGAVGTETGAVPILTDLIDAPGKADETAALAQEVFTRVMAEVEGRLAADLENRLVQHLLPQVHAAVVSAMGDLRQELANAIGDAVAAALEARQVK
jgi:hypothetical protein